MSVVNAFAPEIQPAVDEKRRSGTDPDVLPLLMAGLQPSRIAPSSFA